MVGVSALNSEAFKRPKLLIVTTVPETLTTILKWQPRFLNTHFSVVLASSPDNKVSEVERNEGVPFYSVRMRRGISPLDDLLSILSMIRLLIAIKPTIIHSYTPKAGLVSMLAGFVCRVPIRIHTFTGLIFPTQSGWKKWMLVAIDKLICFCATRIVPEGHGVLSDLSKYRITSKPLQVIGAGNIAGVDTSFFDPSNQAVLSACSYLRQQLSIPESSFVFCFVGRLNRDKGIKELVLAFLKLPESAVLLLVGGVDETAPIDYECQQVINGHPRIYALGFQSDIRPALKLSNVLVLPSYREGFPNVVLQAGAMCLPVIATDINGCNEVVRPGFNGWLVPVRDVGALADAMNAAIICAPSVLESMGNHARGNVQYFLSREYIGIICNLFIAQD